MKFRTEIDVAPLAAKIGYDSRILALGSCFSEHIAARLAVHKFRVVVNPSGILFNPLSIASAIGSFHVAEPLRRDELHSSDGIWFHYGFHGTFSAPTADEALDRMNAARQAGAEALRMADVVLLTLGTAWVYERGGEVVANCHRQPAAEFVRRRVTVAQIVEAYKELFAGPLADKHIILTVSPVRHLGDGLEGNAISKAVLRLAAEELAAADNIDYFPAYELLTDDLRDYRFYADDLVHPAPQAIDYIWEKFATAALTPQAQQLLPKVAQIVAAAAHRPLHPRSDGFKTFCRRQLEAIARMPGIDLSAEKALLRRFLEINS